MYFLKFSVYVTPPALVTSTCRLNIANFPFDEKECTLTFARFLNLFNIDQNHFNKYFNLKQISWMYSNEFIVMKANSNLILNSYIRK
jgi:hypothetical protein